MILITALLVGESTELLFLIDLQVFIMYCRHKPLVLQNVICYPVLFMVSLLLRGFSCSEFLCSENVVNLCFYFILIYFLFQLQLISFYNIILSSIQTFVVFLTNQRQISFDYLFFHSYLPISSKCLYLPHFSLPILSGAYFKQTFFLYSLLKEFQDYHTPLFC